MDISQPVVASVACRHCKTAKATRPRELCFRCYYTPGLRDLQEMIARGLIVREGKRRGAVYRLP